MWQIFLRQQILVVNNIFCYFKKNNEQASIIFVFKQFELIPKETIKEIYFELDTLLEMNDWKERLSKRGLAFFSIIKKLVREL